MICVTRARVTCPTSANSACVDTAPVLMRESNRIASAINRATRGTRPGVADWSPDSEVETPRSRPRTTNRAVIVTGIASALMRGCREWLVMRSVSPIVKPPA